jgi:uncharacterized protein
MIDFNDIPVFDHHAHSLSATEKIYNVTNFTKWFTESCSAKNVEHTVLFNYTILNLAEFFNCNPDIDSIISSRNKCSFKKLVNCFFTDAKIEYLLCDHGFQTMPKKLNNEELKSCLPCKVDNIIRIETLAETLLLKHNSFFDFIKELETVLNNSIMNKECRAFKSVSAYRSGLKIDKTNLKIAEEDYNNQKSKKSLRIESKALIDLIVNTALEIADKNSFPFQFHTGFGDRDVFLPNANPVLLTTQIEKYKNVKFILLHSGWPYYKETAFLSAIYENAWIDLSLMIPFLTCGISVALKEIFGIAPLNKILFATDAFTFPEIFWIAVKLGKKNIGELFDMLYKNGYLNAKSIDKYAFDIFYNNSKTLYLN